MESLLASCARTGYRTDWNTIGLDGFCRCEVINCHLVGALCYLQYGGFKVTSFAILERFLTQVSFWRC